MSTQPQQPTQPEYHAIEEHLCTFCGDMIEDCSSFEDTFEPKNAEEEADGFIHNHCIHARRAADLTAEERFNMVRLVAAMEIISEMSDDLLKKFDAEKGVNFELECLKMSVEHQLDLLNPDPSPYSEPQLLFMREQDIIRSVGVLSRLSAEARHEFRTAEETPIETKLDRLRVEIRKERYEFIERAYQGMKEASYVA